MTDYEEIRETFPLGDGETVTELKQKFEEFKKITVNANNIAAQQNIVSSLLSSVNLQIENVYLNFTQMREILKQKSEKFYESNSLDTQYLPREFFDPMSQGIDLLKKLTAWYSFKTEIATVAFEKFIPVAKELMDAHVAQKASEENLKTIKTVFDESVRLMNQRDKHRDDMFIQNLQMISKQNELSRKEYISSIKMFSQEQQSYMVELLRALMDANKITHEDYREQVASIKQKTRPNIGFPDMNPQSIIPSEKTENEEEPVVNEKPQEPTEPTGEDLPTKDLTDSMIEEKSEEKTKARVDIDSFTKELGL